MTTDQLRQLLAEATPGPWVSAHPSGRAPGAIWHPQAGPSPNIAVAERHIDAAAIVAVMNHASLLLDVVDAAQTLNRHYKNDLITTYPYSWKLLQERLTALDEVTQP